MKTVRGLKPLGEIIVLGQVCYKQITSRCDFWGVAAAAFYSIYDTCLEKCPNAYYSQETVGVPPHESPELYKKAQAIIFECKS